MGQITRQNLNLETAARLERLAEYLDNDDAIAKGKMTMNEYINYEAALRYAIRALKEENK